MEDARKKIQKISKIIYTISKIILIIMIISCCVVFIVGTSSIFINDNDTLDRIRSFLDDEGIFETLDSIGLKEVLNFKTLIIVGCLIHIITRAVIAIYLKIVGNIFQNIAKGGQPFTDKNAKVLFYLSLSLLVFVFINPLIAILLMLFGLFLSHLFSYGTYLNQKAEETKHIQESMIVSFAEVVENKSEQTGLHVKRVAEYSKTIALELGYSEEDSEKIKMASMMHDIGKLLVPSEILEKPAKLTDQEYNEIKKHPGYGEKLLKDVDGDVLIMARRIAHEHHERFDGRGYPDGLGATSISMEGRIVAVADVYDALTSKRSYKDAWSEKDAYNEIVKNSGTQFDSAVVNAFTRCYDKINDIRKKFVD